MVVFARSRSASEKPPRWLRLTPDDRDMWEPPEMDRATFVGWFSDNYQAGEHVTIVGPTNSGKTTLTFRLLDEVATPERPAVILVLKPKDDTVDQLAKLDGFRKTMRWPPATQRNWRPGASDFGRKTRGFIFWPKQSLSDIRRDDDMLSAEFGRAITDCYRAGNRIIFVDEAHAVQNELKLQREMDAVLMRGRSLGCGGWMATQRPRNVTLNMYSQAEHLILFRTPDDRDTDVYRQIGGVDPKLIVAALDDLELHDSLYIGRTKGEDGDATMIIVRGDP